MVRSANKTGRTGVKHGGGRGVFVPGVWESNRQRHLAEIERGDARALFGMTEDGRAQFNKHPNSTAAQAKSALESMHRGAPQLALVPNRRDFPVVADVEWMRGPGRCPRVLVYPDGWCEEHWPDWATGPGGA
jgi:hypothetical protein